MNIWQRIWQRLLNFRRRRPPQPVPPEPVEPTGEPLTDKWDEELFHLHNDYRRRYGAPRLTHSETLDAEADAHSVRMMVAGSLFHSRSGAENVAGYSDSPEATFSQWTDSRGHRRNILDANHRDVGFGVAADERGRHYWTVRFG